MSKPAFGLLGLRAPSDPQGLAKVGDVWVQRAPPEINPLNALEMKFTELYDAQKASILQLQHALTEAQQTITSLAREVESLKLSVATLALTERMLGGGGGGDSGGGGDGVTSSGGPPMPCIVPSIPSMCDPPCASPTAELPELPTAELVERDLPTWKQVRTIERLVMLGEGKLEGYTGCRLDDGTSWKKDSTNRARLSELTKLSSLVRQCGTGHFKNDHVVVQHYTLRSGDFKLASMSRHTSFDSDTGLFVLKEPGV